MSNQAPSVGRVVLPDGRWFMAEKARRFHGMNPVSVGTALYITPAGVLVFWGSGTWAEASRAREISAANALLWLTANDHKVPDEIIAAVADKEI